MHTRGLARTCRPPRSRPLTCALVDIAQLVEVCLRIATSTGPAGTGKSELEDRPYAPDACGVAG